MLRMAVMACMTVVTGISTTVATGTLLVSMLSQQVHAAIPPTVSDDGKTVTYDGNQNSGIKFSTLNEPVYNDATVDPAAVELVVFDITEGGRNYLDNTTGYAGTIKIGLLNYDNGLILNDGGNKTYEISNKIIGHGRIKKTGAGDGMVLNFTGDVSEFEGDIVLGASVPFTLKFGKDGVNAVSSQGKGASGTGAISFTGNNDTLVYAYAPSADTVYITNSITNSLNGTSGTSKVKLTGGADYCFTKGLTINQFSMEGGSARFDSGGVYLLNTTVSGGATIIGNATADGASDTRLLNLDVTGPLTIEGQVSLCGTVTLRETVTNKGTVILRLDTEGQKLEPLKINLATLTPEISGSGKGATGTYTLFSGGNVIGAKNWTNFDLSTLTSDELVGYITGVDPVGKSWSFADGKIIYTILSSDLVWNQKDSSFNWHVETEFAGGVQFSNDDNVSFAENLGTVTATIDGDIVVSQLTVGNGTDLVLAGTGDMELSKAVFGESAGLTIAANREMTWAPGVGTEGSPATLTVLGKLTVENGAFDDTATITVDGGKLTVKGKDAGGAYLKGDVLLNNSGVLEVTEGSDLFNYEDDNKIEILNGAELNLNATRVSFQASDKLILNNGTVSGTGDQNGCLDFFQNNGTVTSSGTSVINAPLRLRTAGQTTNFNVTDGTLTISETVASGGTLNKQGSGILTVTGNLKHTGTTTVSAGTLQFGGTTLADSAVVLSGGNLAVTAEGSASLVELRGAGTITVSEGGLLTLNKMDVGAAGISVTGIVSAGADFAKIGDGVLTLDALNVGGPFNMNGWEKMTLKSIHVADGAELIYSAGDVLSIGSVTSAVSLNVFDVADQLASGVDTGITLAEGQEVQDLKDMLTVKGLDSFKLEVDENRRVWLSSTASHQSDWDLNWGAAELSKAPKTVAQGSIASLRGTDFTNNGKTITVYEIYGNETYTPADGVVAISLTGEGNANAVVVGGNDANADPGTGKVATDVWIEANEGTYKALVGGNHAQNWGSNGVRADFEGNAHIKVDGATIGTIVGGNFKDGQSPSFIGDTFISVFSGDVTGSIIGAGVAAHNQKMTQTGDTNIFVYTPLSSGESRLTSEPNDMIIGGFSWITNVSKGQELSGNTNILVDTTKYEGSATEMVKHIVGGNYNNTASTQTITGSTNVVLDLGEIALKDAYKVVGGNWCDYGSTDIGTTNITIKSGTYKAPVVGGSWIAGQGGTHAIDETKINITGGTLTGSNLFGGSRVGNGSPTLTAGDISIVIDGDAVVNHVYGGHSIESGGNAANENKVVATTNSIEITVDDNAHVMGTIVGGSLILRNNNSQSSFTTGDIVINLNDGQLSGSVYGAGESLGTLKQTVDNVTINLSADIQLPGKTISGGFDGETTNTADCTISGTSKLAFTDAVTYSNIVGTQFRDFNAIELADGATVAITSFDALNKEVTISGAGTLRMANTSAVALDKLTLSGATVTIDNGIAPTTGLSLHITKPSQLILPTKVGEQSLTLASLEIDMTGASASKPYVDIEGALLGTSNVAITLTGVSSLAPGEYKLISAESVAISADDLQVTYDTTAPEGMEYKVEIVGSNLIFRSAFLSPWVWEGSTNGEGNVWSDNEDGWKSEEGSPNGQNVYFIASAAGVVEVSGVVTPANVNITGGEYTFIGNTADSAIKLGENGVLNISDGATLELALDNPELGGSTVLGGKLVLKSKYALGDSQLKSQLKFNGGTLVYASVTDDADNTIHFNTDLSAQAGLAADYTGPVKIEVTHADNSVTWGSTDLYKSALPGVQAILEKGIDFNAEAGAGKMHILFEIDPAQTYNGDINVGAGELYYTVALSAPTFAGAVNVESGAKLGFNTTLKADSAKFTVSGAITGGGVVELGSDGVASGRYALTGNNSAFAGTIALLGDGTSGNYNYVAFKDGNAFGGADTTVRLDGRGIYFREAPTTHATVEVIGNKESNALEGMNGTRYVFLGKWKGAEDAQFRANDYNITVALAGDLSEYEGTFTSSASNTWVLGGEGVAGTGSLDMKELNGSGTFKVQYSSETMLNTVVGGTAKLQQSGAGKLILTAENTTKGTLTVDKDTEVQLGNAATPGVWAGSELAGEGTFILTYGELRGLTTKADGAKLVVKTTKSAESTFAIGDGGGTIVALTGSDASLLDSIELAEGSTLHVDRTLLEGGTLIVGGTGNTKLDMAFTTDNLGANLMDIKAMIQGCNLTIAGTDGVKFNLTNADVLTALNSVGTGDLYLQVTDGSLTVGDGVNINDVINPNLLGLGVRAQLTEKSSAGVYLVINGKVTDVYFTDNQVNCSNTTADKVEVKDGVLGIYAATVVNTNDTLTVKADTTINNLNGQEGGNVVIADGAEVTLNNQQMPTGVPKYDPMGANNTLAGSLTGQTGTSITVKGEGGSLTVGGALTADTLIVASGDLIANAGADVATLTVADGATMTVAKGMQLKDGSIQGVLKADVAGTSLSTTGQVSVGGMVSNMDLTIEDGSLVYLSGDPAATNKGAAYLNSLRVEEGATLMGTGAKVDVGASQPSTFAGSLSGDGHLTTSGDTQLTFDNATGAEGWDVTNKGNMLIDITDSGTMKLGQLTLAAGSDTTLKFNSDSGMAGLLDLQLLSVDSTAQLTLQTIGGGQLDAGEHIIGSVMDGYEGEKELHAILSGTAFSRLDKTRSYITVNDNGDIVLVAVKSTVNELDKSASDPNAHAGADLLWNSTAPVGGELEEVYNAVDKMIADGNTEAANETMASLAGSSTAALGMALSGDVERQLRAIRNRTTTMGVNRCVVNEGMPYFNAWVNAEGNFGELDQDGLASGYSLDSWGGTVGFDVDVNPNLTLGLALTAMYGDLTVDGPDMLDGDMDTYYLSAFARYSERAWTHTFIATIGMMDSSYERTVSYGDKSYTAEGDTDGMALALMYEVGRVYNIDEDGDACWQPVFNVAYRHTTVGGYTETGSDAALTVDDQTLDTITLGAGARVQAIVGENIFNRTSVFEARALAKFDIGDRASEADVALINGTGHSSVESAEMGAFGVELGAGLSVPVGDENDGTIFFDVSAELRSGYTNFNGTVGYRINF